MNRGHSIQYGREQKLTEVEGFGELGYTTMDIYMNVRHLSERW